MNSPRIRCISKCMLFLLLFTAAKITSAVTITGDTSVCENETATYSVSPVSGGTYNWTAAGGNIIGSGSNSSVTVTWGNPGAATISISVTDANNQTTFGSLNVTIHPNPNPQITWAPYPTCPSPHGGQGSAGLPDRKDDCIKVCKNSIHTYSTPQHAGSSYLWTVTGATSFTGQGTNSVTVNWDTASLGLVLVVETNQWGCVDSASICIEKVDLPVALFSGPTSVCLNTTNYFTNLSTGANSYQWNFGDGGTSGATHPSYAYSNPGTYTVTLVAMNACHCTDTFQATITVDSLPGPDIECPSTVCAGDTASYYTNATGCTYNWIVTGGTIISGAGTSAITVAWGPGMLGYVQLFVTGCGALCSDTTTIIIPIVPAVATISGPIKVCPGDCHTYTLPDFSGAIYTWTLNGAGSIVSQHCNEATVCWLPTTLFSSDTLNVSYYDSFLNCGGTASLIIHVRPELSLFTNTPVCANALAGVSAFPGINCFWSISPPGPIISGNGTSFITINWLGMTGNFTVTAAPVNPNQTCNDSAFTQITVVAPPPMPVITGDTIICPNQSYSYCATGTNIFWIITGGTPATGNGSCISVTWGNTGPYIVQAYQQMTVPPACSSNIATQNITSALPILNPNITGPNNGCANGTSSFSNTTLYPAGAIFTWSLALANAGSIISGQGTNSVTIQWGNNAPSTVVISLTVDVCGQTVTATKNINLVPPPNPSIVVNGIFCPGVPVTLSAVGGTFVSYQWSGPGGFSSTSNPSSLISLSGYYQVTVTDVNGCTASATKQVNQLPGPLASISTSDYMAYCIGTSFTVQLNALTNPNYSYSWSNGSTTNPTSVSLPGTYTVTVTDQNGCTAVSNFITITQDSCNGGTGTCVPTGTVSFNHPAFYGCNPMTFINTSTNAGTFSWNYGDGNFSNTVNGTNFYAQAGFYLVILSGYVPNALGTDSCLLTDTAHIEVPLSPNFSFTSGCLSDSACFTDLSTYTVGNNITSWNWNFGDASTSTLQDPCHLYSLPGSYIVSLTISNGTCSSTFSDTVLIITPPNAAFSFNDTACLNSNVLFTDLSTPSININYWSWTFGDAGTSLNQNPNHSYSNTGDFVVQLIVKDIYGCTDTTSDTITIVSPNIPGSISYSPDTIVCAGTNVLLMAPSCLNCTFLWSTGSTNDSIFVNLTGIYSLTITDAMGCSKTLSIDILVNPAPSTVIINYGADEFCLGGSTFLSALVNINYLYSWISNDLSNNGNTNSGISVSPPLAGVYFYSVAIIDTSTSCADTSLPYIITVNDTPVVPVITVLGSSTICDGDTVKLVVTHPDTTVTIQWSTGEINDTICVTIGGCYNVVITDTNGCDNSATSCITVNPLPETCPFWEGCLDTCRPFTIIGPPGNTSYQWLLNGNVIFGATQQNYIATLNGTYSVIVTNFFGCIDTTGDLKLTLHDCDTTCADLIIDSLSCDEDGNHVIFYHVVNNSGHTINTINLLVLPPNLNTLYSPVTVMDTLANGDTSTYSTTVYGGDDEDTICFKVSIHEMDSLGTEIFCCPSDTECVVLPPCDSACCYLNILTDSIWCTGKDTAGNNTYGFQTWVNGCGSLLLQSNGVITGNTNYTLTGGNTLISGTYTNINIVNNLLCLTFVLTNGSLICKDTTICTPFPPCDSNCCYFNLVGDSIWCEPTVTGNIYHFDLDINGCGTLTTTSPSQGVLNVPSPVVLNGGISTLSGTFIATNLTSFCLTFVMINTPVICKDTTICFPLPPCDSTHIIPECNLEFPDSICRGQTATFSYAGNPSGLTFAWTFTSGTPATASGAGPHNVTYSTAGCHPVSVIITSNFQTVVCRDSICVVAPPVATVSQSGNTLFAYPAGMNYQWYVGPPNWSLLTGEVNQFYTPTFSTLFCVEVTDAFGCSDTACIDHQWTGIDEMNSDFNWSIIPNPNNGSFELLVESASNDKMKYTILNIIGETIMQEEFETSANRINRIKISGLLSAGVYIMKLESEGKSGVQKIVVR